MRSVFSLRRRCNVWCVGYIVPQYEASTQYTLAALCRSTKHQLSIVSPGAI